ncbi:MAG: prephenate dehydratase [Saprospiraceae bacterium]|nr:prephenate dehydratase [Saprospiraceae bacterium]
MTANSTLPINSQLSTAPADGQPLRIAIQGYPGAFHEIAAREYFQPDRLAIVPNDSFEDLVRQVTLGEDADAGLMAIENSLAGSIMENYRLLNTGRVQITGEIFLRIRQNLLCLPGQTIDDLREVRSHPVAIAQCLEFFRQYPHIRLVEAVDTAGSARDIQERQLSGVGAIASSLAAELYGLEVLAPGIETNKQNYTRFWAIHRQSTSSPQKSAEKVSLCFSVEHEVGSLQKVLSVFSAYQLNLTKIQSAPIIGRKWEYLFYLDFVLGDRFAWPQAVDAIRPLVHHLQVLGAYPKGRCVEY